MQTFTHKKAKWNEDIKTKNDADADADADSDASDDDDDDNAIDGCSWMSYYYALTMNLKNSIDHVNAHVVEFVNYLLNMFESDVDVVSFIQYAEYFVEKTTFAPNSKIWNSTTTKNKYSSMQNRPPRNSCCTLHPPEPEKHSRNRTL